MKAKIIGICTILLGMTLSSCEDGSNFPDEPYLEYRSYRLVDANVDTALPADHAVIELYFTDGDGDVGIEPIPVGDFNFFADVFERADSGGYQYAYGWPGILKDLADQGQQNKALEGIIYYKVALSEVAGDTAIIEFELIDDAGNSSGIVRSDKLYLDF